jgi:geranylgeranyl diphosphate synthase, type I
MSSASAATAPPAAARAGQPADFDRLLNAFRVRVDREIASFLAAKRAATVALSGSPAGRPPLSDPADLVDGVAALLAQGGKRLRPALVYFTYRACGGQADEQALQLALSTELLHTYLLIHDDIMDHAETRRGLPAAHVRFSDLHRAAGLRGDAADFGRSASAIWRTPMRRSFSPALSSSARRPASPSTAGARPCRQS